MTLREKFARRMGCWLWPGYKNKEGYGMMVAKIRGRNRWFSVHRVAYELFVGPIPRGKIIRHTCDTPSCVNPAHLLAGTHKDNTQDMVSRGRHVKAFTYQRQPGFCRRGHECTTDNVYVQPSNGRKRCRICLGHKARLTTTNKGENCG